MADKPTIVEALAAVMDEVQAVGKKNRNPEQGYLFRGIDAVINAVGPVFRKHGVVAVPAKSQASYRDVLTVKEKRSRECTVSVTYRFYGPAGDFIEAEVPGESMDFGDKGAAKAMSVAYRIALLQVLCIPTDEPEPDAQTYERADVPQYPSWDPETQLLIDAFKDEVRTAKTAGDLQDVGKRVHAALGKGEITQVAYDFLARSAAERLAKLEVPA